MSELTRAEDHRQTRTAPRRSAVLIASVLVLGACSGGGSSDTTTTGQDAADDANLTIEAPGETAAGVVEVSVTTSPFALVRLTGGMLPVTLAADAEGRAGAEIAVVPGTDNALTARLLGADGDVTATTVVRQLGDAAGVVTGIVLGLDDAPLAGAIVSYGTSTAVSDADGAFELAGVPDGRVMFHVRMDGFLGGVGEAVVADGRGEARPVWLTELVDGAEIGPDGGVLTGEGWRVEIPAGAVDAPTLVQATPLEYTGLKDTVGIPVLDLSPTGLTFDEPITVSLDPDRFGLAGAQPAVVGFDPDELDLYELAATDADGWFSVELTTLHGMELRVPVETVIDMFGGMGTWCQPFDYVQALAAKAFLHATLLPFLRRTIGTTSETAYDRYLDGGTPDGSVWPLPGGHEEFATAKETFDAWVTVTDTISNHLPDLRPPGEPNHFRVESVDPDEGYRPINYGQPFTTPGNLAGGVSPALMGNITFTDERQFTGTARLAAEVDERGVVQHVDLITDVHLRVRDAIDFCPAGNGGQGGGSERMATLPLSRLEVTPDGDDGAMWARRYLFSIEVDVGTDSVDVTDRYDNDHDRDGYPETPPWTGWEGQLDNCHEYNPDQSDEDGDGLGDPCDTSDDRDDEDATVAPPTVEFYPVVDCVADRFDHTFDELVQMADPFEIDGPDYGVVFLRPDGTPTERTEFGRMTPTGVREGGVMITGPFFADRDQGQPAGTIVFTSGNFEFTEGRYAECATWDWIDDRGERHLFHLLLVFRDDVEPGAADISFVYGAAEFPAGDTSLADGDLGRMLAAVAGYSIDRQTIGDRQFPDVYFNGAVAYSMVATDVYQSDLGVMTWELRSEPSGD